MVERVLRQNRLSARDLPETGINYDVEEIACADRSKISTLFTGVGRSKLEPDDIEGLLREEGIPMTYEEYLTFAATIEQNQNVAHQRYRVLQIIYRYRNQKRLNR